MCVLPVLVTSLDCNLGKRTYVLYDVIPHTFIVICHVREKMWIYIQHLSGGDLPTVLY